MLLILLAFLAGVLTIAAPCVFAILPIILAGSLTDHQNKKRPLVIVLSLSASIILFTILLKATSLFIGVSTATWGKIAGIVIILVSLSLLFPEQWQKLSFKLKLYKSDELLNSTRQHKRLTGDILTGLALGPVFTSCSPTYIFIAGLILPKNLLFGAISTLSYTIGLAIPLLLIGYGGQKFASKLKPLSDPKSLIKKVFAVIILLFGILIFTGIDKHIETYFISKGFLGFGELEQVLLNKIEN